MNQIITNSPEPTVEEFSATVETVEKLTFAMLTNGRRISNCLLWEIANSIVDADLPIIKNPRDMLNLIVLMEDIDLILSHGKNFSVEDQKRDFNVAVFRVAEGLADQTYSYVPKEREVKRIVT